MSDERGRKYDPRSPPEQKRQADPMRDDPSIIKIRGLPYQTTAMEVCKFFKECEIVGGPNGIYFPMNERGLPTGEAFIEMESSRDIDKAMEKHRDCIGERLDEGRCNIIDRVCCRYIEVFESRMSVLERVKNTTKERGGGVRSRESVRDRGLRGEKGSGSRWRGREVSKYCVKLRGLPWETRKVCMSRAGAL